MPAYDYFCAANGRTVECHHSIADRVRYWAELCYAAGIELGDTDPLAPVERVLTRAPAGHTAPGPAELRNLGFHKLVRRGEGSYEEVTASGRGPRLHTPDED